MAHQMYIAVEEASKQLQSANSCSVRVQGSSVVIGPGFCMLAPGSNPALPSTSPLVQLRKVPDFSLFSQQQEITNAKAGPVT
jgi:hypothetical protein